jgi:hypothetical protein
MIRVWRRGAYLRTRSTAKESKIKGANQED